MLIAAGFFSWLISWAAGILWLMFKITWFVLVLICWGSVVVGLFGAEKKTQGFLSIIPLIAYIFGWIYAEELKIKDLMKLWTVLLVVAVLCGWVL